MKKLILSLILLPFLGFSQTKYAYETFFDTRVINGQSVETNPKGKFKYIIAHRFGAINTGAYNSFGLDQATMRVGMDYGITDRVTIGLGKSTFEKTNDLNLKVKLFYQKSGDESFPVTVSYYHSTAYRKLNFPEDLPYPESARFSYSHQLYIARKFGDRLALQIVPSLLHLNLVEKASDANTLYSVGFAGRYQVKYGMSLSAEYYLTPKDQNSSLANNSLSLGVEFKTNAHVFQIHLSNSRGMTEKFYLAQTAGSWMDGDIYLGFNISRDFQIRPRPYKRSKN